MAGKTKSVQNYISATYPDGHSEVLFTPLAPYETEEALDKICEEYNKVIGNLELEPLIAIPTFIHDFLCIHPFNDGNGRMSRLLTTLLLYPKATGSIKHAFGARRGVDFRSTVARRIGRNRTGYFEKLTRQFINGAKESYKSRLLACRQGKLLLGR